MRATLMYEAGDVRVETVPDSTIKEPTDALVRVTAACICGSDLHPYHSMTREQGPARMGHEFIGIVEDTGSAVRTLKKGDLVVAPFARARLVLGHPAARRRPGRSRARALGRRHPREAPPRRRLDADPVTADPLRCVRHRVPRRRPWRRRARVDGEELMPDILDGSIEPGRVFDTTTDLDGVPAGYKAMDDRTTLKVLVTP